MSKISSNIFHVAFCILQFALYFHASPALAVPETTAVRIADVSPSSFSVVWMTDVAATPSVEVYGDSAMQQRLVDGISITAMPAGSSRVAEAARASGIMKVRVSGLPPATRCYVRTVTADPGNAASVSYSSLQQVTTASGVSLYRSENGPSAGMDNDLLAVPVYIRPADAGTDPGLGNLILIEAQGASYPVTAFAGDGILSPEGVLDLNNLFGEDGVNFTISGNEKMIVRIYRKGTLSTLTQYRKAPLNGGLTSFAGLVAGFFADINLDGNVNDGDFNLFKAQYRTVPNDGVYNPDYNFVDDPEGKVDVREFSTFAAEYGRTDVQ